MKFRHRQPAESDMVEESDRTESTGNRATERIFRILAEFRDGRRDHSVPELSSKLGMTRSMIRRALLTLAEEGFVIRDATGERYQLGPRLLELSRQFNRDPSIIEFSLPFVHRALRLVQETITISVRAGRHSVIVGGMEPEQQISRRLMIGRVSPLHVTAAGRAILAFLPPEEIARYLTGGLERFTSTTITDPGQLYSEISRISTRKYAEGNEDYTPGTGTIAFPILDIHGIPHGALGVVGPKERLTDERIESLLPDLLKLMVQLNRQSSLLRSQNNGSQI
jgi:DNA-binding IclR family transcriptional regulator